jgi:SAM-dependent methyltransferase
MEDPTKFYELDDECQKLKQDAEEELYHLTLLIECETITRYNRFDNLLEVGCGNGHFLHLFGDKEVLGIDKNPEMLKHARNLEGKIEQADIVTDSAFVEKHRSEFDFVVANYVFTVLTKSENEKAFANIFSLLSPRGAFCFTITNPRTRHLMEFPGYKLVFDEKYSYEKEDLPFTVLLRKKSGEYVDVGIRDFHQPIETYDALLAKAGFRVINRWELGPSERSHALLYEVRKYPSQMAF